jgi:hypothetical protein
VDKCGDDGCLEYLEHGDDGRYFGWHRVQDRWYCSLHGPIAERRLRKDAEIAEMRARIESLARERHRAEAKATMPAADYAAWDRFQSDLADYHKAHGRLAPQALRMMSPGAWGRINAASGPIDVEKAAAELEAVEITKKA